DVRPPAALPVFPLADQLEAAPRPLHTLLPVVSQQSDGRVEDVVDRPLPQPGPAPGDHGAVSLAIDALQEAAGFVRRQGSAVSDRRADAALFLHPPRAVGLLQFVDAL